MRVLFILSDNIYLTPYFNFYKELLKKLSIDYDVIYWDKNINEIITKQNYYRISFSGKGKLSKILGYVKFRKAIKKKLKENNYDVILPLHSIVSFILADVLLFFFKNRYIYDIRDYSYEKFFVYRLVQKQLVKNSLMNIISSEGYKIFLPKGEYFTTHNLPNMIDLNEVKQLKNNCTFPIQLSYIGLIRFQEQNKKVINFFANDSRFQLNFIGTNAEELREFCQEKDIRNVNLVDTFQPKDTLSFYKNTDVILNLYGNHTPLLDYALSNKLYFAALLYKPILVCEDTYMEKVSIENGFGFVLPMKDESEKDYLVSYVQNLDRKKLIKNCDSFMDRISLEKQKTEIELEKRIISLRKKND
ncbi:capsular biosynthesis protein [Streptococcus infantis]|jgi:capsular polysaccharide biosynthesis protein cps4G|uniref:capsular biosynthesis protein n=1 Tax=Streptococcus infantis TaxID=68892 RepID=UPI0039C1DAF4